jgi:hypothetical protein
MIFDSSAQRASADDALRAAHIILLQVLNVQAERFKVPGLSEQLEKCEKDVLEIYGKSQEAALD